MDAKHHVATTRSHGVLHSANTEYQFTSDQKPAPSKDRRTPASATPSHQNGTHAEAVSARSSPADGRPGCRARRWPVRFPEDTRTRRRPGRKARREKHLRSARTPIPEIPRGSSDSRSPSSCFSAPKNAYTRAPISVGPFSAPTETGPAHHPGPTPSGHRPRRGREGPEPGGGEPSPKDTAARQGGSSYRPGREPAEKL